MGLEKRLDSVTESDLQELIDNQVAEKRTIDYKQELHLGTDAERKEFLFDVSSFSNASGGHVPCGISETDGYPERLIGISIDREDELILRIELMLMLAPHTRSPVPRRSR
jgi:predicted HTH transcriptional regulator